MDETYDRLRRDLLFEESRSIHATTDPENSGTKAPPLFELKKGARFGRYEIVGKIAEGGMGAVYEGLDPTLRRRVAIKLLRQATEGGPALDRLLREARTAARLSHPGIVRIHEVGAIEGESGTPPAHFIAMNLVSGGTLKQRHQEMDPRAVVRVLRDVAAAIGHAHEGGVVHRDLKPQNILFTAQGIPVISDFGCARWEDASQELTRTGSILGTPLYMSPEQVEGTPGTTGPASDVWALGVMLFETITGVSPFGAETVQGLFRQILHGQVRITRPLMPGFDSGIKAICLKALERNPRGRYADGTDLSRDLGRWLDGKRPHARVPGLVRTWWSEVRRRPWPWVVVVSAFVVAAAVLVTWKVAGDHSPRVERGEKTETRIEIDQVEHAREWVRETILNAPLPEVDTSWGIPCVSPVSTARDQLSPLEHCPSGPFFEGALLHWNGFHEEALAVLNTVSGDALEGIDAALVMARSLYLLSRFEEGYRRIQDIPSGADPRASRVAASLAMACAMKETLRGRPGLEWLERVEQHSMALEAQGHLDEARVLRGRALLVQGKSGAERGVDPASLLEVELEEILEGNETMPARLLRGDAALCRAIFDTGRGRIDPAEPTAFDHAISLYKPVLEDPRLSEVAQLRVAQAHLERYRFIQRVVGIESQADLLQALEICNRALGARPGQVNAALEVAWIEWRLQLSLRSTSEDHLLDCLEKGRKRIGAVLERHGSYLPALLMDARLLQKCAERIHASGTRLRFIRLAVEHLDRCLLVHPEAAMLHLERGGHRLREVRYLARQGHPTNDQLKAVHAEISRTVALLPDRAFMWRIASSQMRFLAWMVPWSEPAMKRAVFEHCLALADRAVDLDGSAGSHASRAEAHREMGNFLEMRRLDGRGSFARAEVDIRRAIEINPRRIGFYGSRALILQILGKALRSRGLDPGEAQQAAILACQQGIERNPVVAGENSSIHLILASLCIENGLFLSESDVDPSSRYREAIDAASRSLEIDPGQIEARWIRSGAGFHLARYLAGRDLDPRPLLRQSLQDIDRVIETLPANAARRKRIDERITILEYCIGLEPGVPVHRARLGRDLWLQGKKEEGAKMIEGALQRDPSLKNEFQEYLEE